MSDKNVGNKEIEVEDGLFKEMMVASRELAMTLNKDQLTVSDELLVSNCKKKIVENISKLKEVTLPGTKEEMFVSIVGQIIIFLDEHGYTPEAFYDYQLEHGTLS